MSERVEVMKVSRQYLHQDTTESRPRYARVL